MNSEKMREQVHAGIDSYCSSLNANPYRVQRVLDAANKEGELAQHVLKHVPEGGNIKMKRKLPLVFVFVLIFMCLATVAFAATLLWKDYAPQVKQQEQEMGRYAKWPAEKRIELVQQIADMGYIASSEKTAVLYSETASITQKQQAADDLMLTLTGHTDIKEVELNTITYAILGYEDSWSPEERVWWQGIINMYREEWADPDLFVLPTNNVPTEEEAVAIAKAAIIEAYELPENALNNA